MHDLSNEIVVTPIKNNASLYPDGYHKPVDIDKARKALGRFCIDKETYSIPVRADDDDMLLSRALDELEKYRNLDEVYIVYNCFKKENDGICGVYLNEKIASDCLCKFDNESDGYYMTTHKLTK